MTNYSGRKLNVGIIGLGVGESHIDGYLKHESCRIITLCDFDETVYKNAKKKYPDYKIVKDANEIIEDPDVDVVSIASWDNYHHDQIIKGLDNNKHLFIEKPICLNEEEAISIINKIKAKPELKISSNLILRKVERFVDLKNMINNGVLGELSFISASYNYGRLNKLTDGWRGKIPFYSIILGGAIHIVDLIMWLTGDKIQEVSSYANNTQSKNTKFNNLDLVTTILKFKSGLVANINTNFGNVSPHFHQIEVYGTKATFQNNIDFAKVYYSRDPKNFNKSYLIDDKPIREYKDYELRYTDYKGTQKGEHLYSFIDSIVNDSEPEININDIFNSLSVCLAIESSITMRKKLRVNYIK
jgi:predicted dehydrogenase